MSRKILLLCLGCLALVAGSALVYTHLHRPQPASPSSGLQPQASTPARSLDRIAAPNATAATFYLEPDAGFTWLYNLVNTAQTSIDMTMYELVDTTFSADLVAACQRGVKVRVILDQNLEKTYNTPAYNQLAAAGPNCSVAWANPQFQATHQKTLLLDNKTAVVMTFNLTTRYYPESRDMALLDSDAADFSAIQKTFNADFRSTTDLNFKPAAGDDLIWSPTTAQADLTSLIAQAKKTLLVENEELGAATIVNALATACKRGVQVSLAMTDTNANYHANYTTLEAAGCGVHIGANDPTTLYIHAKAIVADLGTATAVGYLGSINFSVASMTQNRELGLYLHDAATLQSIASAITADYNQFPAYTANTVTLPAPPHP